MKFCISVTSLPKMDTTRKTSWSLLNKQAIPNYAVQTSTLSLLGPLSPFFVTGPLSAFQNLTVTCPLLTDLVSSSCTSPPPTHNPLSYIYHKTVTMYICCFKLWMTRHEITMQWHGSHCAFEQRIRPIRGQINRALLKHLLSHSRSFAFLRPEDGWLFIHGRTPISISATEVMELLS